MLGCRQSLVLLSFNVFIRADSFEELLSTPAFEGGVQLLVHCGVRACSDAALSACAMQGDAAEAISGGHWRVG
jgi:hypothetical protein